MGEAIHKYFLENDIILMSGEDAIKILSSGNGNHIAFDYDSIVKTASSTKYSSDKFAAQDFLKNLNNYTKQFSDSKIEKDKITLANDSIIEFYKNEDNTGDYIHLTKDSITELELKRKGQE